MVVFLVLFSAGGIANFVGTRSTVDAFRDVSTRMENDGEALSRLRADVVSTALLRSAAVQRLGVDKSQLDAASAAEAASFSRAIRVLRPGGGREIIEHQYEAAKALWPGDITTLSAVEFVSTAAKGRANFARIDEAALASQAEARADLAAAADLERRLTMATAGVSLLLAVLVLRFSRRLASEVLRPVAALRDSANRLAAGELDHRIDVGRADEIGDVAAAFNSMADALAASHRDLSLQANQDALTAVANRVAFHSRLQAALSVPDRREGGQAVVFVDLDDFKDVNDRLGHDAGDEVLRAVATRLTEAVRPGDLVARLGGDEFALLLDGIDEPGVALDIANRAIAVLAAPVTVSGTRVRVGASAGLAMRSQGSDSAGLMRQADIAMYAAKRQGKNRVERYDGALHQRVPAVPTATL